MTNGWATIELERVADIDSGGNAPQGKQFFEDGKYPFIRVQHFDGSKTYIDRFDLINDEAVKKYRLKKFKKDSIIFPKSGASIRLEKRAKLPFDAYVVSHLCVVQPQNIFNDFLFYLLKKIKFAESGGGSTLPFLNISQIKKTRITIPKNQSEQQTIATILSKIQEAIENQDKIIKTTTELKKSLMKKIFSEGLNGEPLKETEIGKIPKSWEVSNIESVTKSVYRYPTYYGIEYVSDGVPEVRGELLLETGEIENNKNRFRFISEKTASEFPRVRLVAGDIIMSVRGTMGKIGIVRNDNVGGVITANLIRLETDKSRIDPEYFRWILLSDDFQQRLLAASPQTTIKTITAPVLKSLPLPLPPMTEQRQIAKIFSVVNAKIETGGKLKNTKTDLFKSMLNNLMSGKIRVDNLKL